MNHILKGYIETHIDLIEDQKYEELFNLPQCPSGLGYILLAAGIDFLSKMHVIPSGCFGGTELTSIDIPEGVEEIEGFAFAECSKLTHVKLPKSLKYLHGHIFCKCGQLTELEYSGTSVEFRLLELNSGMWYLDSRISRIKCSDGYIKTQR